MPIGKIVVSISKELIKWTSQEESKGKKGRLSQEEYSSVENKVDSNDG